MVIPKFICIPLLILVPLIILFSESKEEDFTVPPSDEEVAQKVESWKATRPSLKEVELVSLVKDKDPSEEEKKSEGSKPEKEVIVNDALKGIDLDVSPGLNHFQGMKAERLKGIAKQLDPDLYPELVYLANERILDSAPDSSVGDRHDAGEYLRQNGRPLWNPEASTRMPVKVNLNVEASHYEKAKVFSPTLESAIFFGSGGTVEATVIVTKVEKAQNSISLTGKNSTDEVAVVSISDTEKMVVNAIQQVVTQTVKDNKLPILHTDKIHYTYYTRLTWLKLAKSL